MRAAAKAESSDRASQKQLKMMSIELRKKDTFLRQRQDKLDNARAEVRVLKANKEKNDELLHVLKKAHKTATDKLLGWQWVEGKVNEKTWLWLEKLKATPPRRVP